MQKLIIKKKNKSSQRPLKNLATLILAAGQASRFGSAKQVAILNNEPMLSHSVSIARKNTPSNVHVVVGAYKNLVTEHLPQDVNIIENKYWQQGLGCSLATGIKLICDYYQREETRKQGSWHKKLLPRKVKSVATIDGVLILLADQVAITTQDIKRLITSWQAAPTRIHCAFYNSQCGVPAIFPASYFEQLQTLNQDVGAKRVLMNSESKRQISMPNAGIDIDTPEQLIQWQRAQNIETAHL
ncbi:nucleotidyltransferase family protein [Flocculibacter collagenilyticus]|uniref:nucleotidyltransferase family protein n=1 Tax=Flocculibacter collagenilyticus TaxID=2744479 RepID=UPI0018F610FC|nr:nucleotidyltransferase family protein [Flocculibacter collagenilyticus]